MILLYGCKDSATFHLIGAEGVSARFNFARLKGSAPSCSSKREIGREALKESGRSMNECGIIV